MKSEKYMEIVRNSYEFIRSKTSFVPDAAIVLGSGLGALADELDKTECVINYGELRGFPVSTVPGHAGRFVMGYLNGVKVIVMQGRVHYYEGYKVQEVVIPIRVMKKLGASTLFLTNASGGINPSFSAGDFMIIEDQISTFVPSPLRGANYDDFGTRFPDMSEIYDSDLIKILEDSAASLGINIKKGVYVQTPGPNFESKAEIRMLRTLGADAVGMSTAGEALAANHAGMHICGISCVANLACGMTDQPLTHEEVQAAANAAAPPFKALIKDSVKRIGEHYGYRS